MSKRADEIVDHYGRLTARQERFCIEYAKSGNGEQSVAAAGFKSKNPRGYSSHLLRNPNIQARVREHIDAAASAEGVTLAKVLEEYSRIAFCDLADFLTVDEGGLVIPKPQSEMPKGWGRSVRKIKTKRAIKEAADGSSVLVYDDSEIELWPKTDALEKLGKYLGMFSENRNADSLTKERIKEVIQGMADSL